MWPVTCDMWYVIYDQLHVTCDMWPVTCDLWSVTCDLWHVTSAYLEFPPGVKLLQTLNGLLSVHTRCHCGAMLGGTNTQTMCTVILFTVYMYIFIFICIIKTHRDPGVFQSLSCCDPFGRIDGQHLIDEIFGFRSHCVPFRRRKLRGGVVKKNNSFNRALPTTHTLTGDWNALLNYRLTVSSWHVEWCERAEVVGHMTYIIRSSFDLLVETMLIFIPEWRITDQ